MPSYLSNDYTINYMTTVATEYSNSYNTFLDNFGITADNAIPDGFTVNQQGSHDPGEDYCPRIVANGAVGADPLDKILALRGLVVPGLGHAAAEAPVQSGYWRFVEINQGFTVPLTITFDFIAGGTNAGDNVYGLTNAPESAGGEHLYFQYKIGDGDWNTIETFENTGNQYQASFNGYEIIFNANQDTTNEAFFRWISKTNHENSETGADAWGIKNIKFAPIIPLPFRLSSKGPMNLRGQTSSQFYKVFTGEG